MTETARNPTRRNLLRILAVGGAAGVAWKLGLFDRWRERTAIRSRLLMGTVVHLTVIGEDLEAAEAAADACLDRMAGLERLLSRHRADSEVSRLAETGRLLDTSDALLDVLAVARRVSDLGDGAFDVTVQPVLDVYRARMTAGSEPPRDAELEPPLALVDHRALRVEGRSVTLERPGMRITLDGVAKGYVVDRGVDVLREHGFANVFVEAGGDLVAGGSKDSGTPWRVGIRGPRPGIRLQATFEAQNRAVATSGDYMQPFTSNYELHHIIDPRTGRSAPELASATVVAPDAATADALATLSMVLGSRLSLEILEELRDCEGYLVTKELRVVQTSGFRVS